MESVGVKRIKGEQMGKMVIKKWDQDDIWCVCGQPQIDVDGVYHICPPCWPHRVVKDQGKWEKNSLPNLVEKLASPRSAETEQIE